MAANRMEAERLLGVAEKFLQNQDFNGSRDSAILAQEAEPLLEGSDQILAVIDVLLAADKRVNNHHDWYAILQLDRPSDDFYLIKKQYRRLALLLHPDKNRFSLADNAFRLVAEAWAVLSDQTKKANFDKELNFFTSVHLSMPSWVQRDKLPVRRGGPGSSERNQGPDPRSGGSAAREEETDENPRRRPTFWTTCRYCYYIYEYPKIYENYCLRCQNCEKSFHGVSIPSLPPLVPGQEAYHFCWGFFPMGFFVGNTGGKSGVPSTFNSQPPVSIAHVENGIHSMQPPAAPSSTASRGATPVVLDGTGPELGIVKRKPGRPRKNPFPA